MNASTQAAAAEMVSRFFHLVSTRDLQVLDEFATGDDVLLVGSDAGEISSGRTEVEAFFARLFARDTTFSWETGSISATRAGDVIWFFADGKMIVNNPAGSRKALYRIAGVLHKDGERWVWKQYVGSEPVSVD